MTESEAKAIYRPAATLKELHHRNYPGGETRKEFYDRCVEGIKACADMEKENLIIVAHKGTIQNIIFYWLGFDIEEVNKYNFSVDILPGSVTVLGINKWLEHSIFLLMIRHIYIKAKDTEFFRISITKNIDGFSPVLYNDCVFKYSYRL